MYKNNSWFSSKFKGCSPLQLLCNLTEKCYAVGYYSYTKRCQQWRASVDRDALSFKNSVDRKNN